MQSGDTHQYQPKEVLYLLLSHLEFQKFLDDRCKRKGLEFLREVDFHPSMFDSNNKVGLQAVSLFFVHCYSIIIKDFKYEKKLLSFFPCLERSQETDFRKLMLDIISSLEKDPDFKFEHKIPLANCFMTPSGETLIFLLIKMFLFICTKRSQVRKDRQTIRQISSVREISPIIQQSLDELKKEERDHNHQAHQLHMKSTLLVSQFKESKEMWLKARESLQKTREPNSDPYQILNEIQSLLSSSTTSPLHSEICKLESGLKKKDPFDGDENFAILEHLLSIQSQEKALSRVLKIVSLPLLKQMLASSASTKKWLVDQTSKLSRVEEKFSSKVETSALFVSKLETKLFSCPLVKERLQIIKREIGIPADLEFSFKGRVCPPERRGKWKQFLEVRRALSGDKCNDINGNSKQTEDSAESHKSKMNFFNISEIDQSFDINRLSFISNVDSPSFERTSFITDVTLPKLDISHFDA